MKQYFFRRLMLIPLTMLGVTFIVFAVSRLAPGGPMERRMQEVQMASGPGSSGGGKQNLSEQLGYNEEQLEELEEAYGYDKAIPVAYLSWLGALPRETNISKAEFRKYSVDKIGGVEIKDPTREVLVILKGTGKLAKITRNGGDVISAVYASTGKAIASDGWQVRLEDATQRQKRWVRRWKKDISKAPKNYVTRAVVYRKSFEGLLQGNLGKSSDLGEPVSSLIWERMKVALHFGLLSFLITYAISLPLGILKAIRHRTWVDNFSSILIFVGYAIPGFALGALMVVHLGARGGWFPIFGLKSPDYEDYTFIGRIMDVAHHTVLPLTCYIIGSFAFLTMMMKNNLMDHLAADYMRTAVSKGVSYRVAIFKHAFRNSLIPLASTIGQKITILVSGSILIEKVFDIQGFGMLMYQGLLGQDTFLIMGTLTFAALLLVIGNILSDLVVAWVDPRVKFN